MGGGRIGEGRGGRNEEYGGGQNVSWVRECEWS